MRLKITSEEIEKIEEFRKVGRLKLNNFLTKITDLIIQNNYPVSTEKLAYLSWPLFAKIIIDSMSDSECNELVSVLDEIFKKEGIKWKLIFAVLS